MTVGFRIAAGYVTVPTAVDGGIAHVDIPQGSLLPDDVPDEHVQALLNAGHIVEEDERDDEPDEKPAAPRKRATKSTK